MKIAFINAYGGKLYGATESLRRLIINWPHGNDDIYLLSVKNDNLKNVVNKKIKGYLEINIPRFRRNPLQFILKAKKTADFLKTMGISIIVWNSGYLAIPYVYLIKTFAGIPYVIIMRDLIYTKSKIRAKHYLDNALLVISVSNNLKKEIERNFLKNSLIVKHIVMYDPLKEILNIDLNKTNNGTKTILLPGRITEIKGQDVLIKAISELNTKDLKVQIVGSVDEKSSIDVRYYKSLLKIISNLNLENVVEIIEYQKNLGAYYKNATITVIPSRKESFGMVPLESWSYGTPTVAADIMGLSETHSKSNGGLLFISENFKDCANKISLLLNDNELYQTLSCNGYNWIKNNSNPIDYSNKFRNIIINEIG